MPGAPFLQGDRRDVDDARPVAPAQRRDRRLAAQEHPLDVHGHGEIEGFLRQRLHRGDADYAGVAHEDVQPTEALCGRGDHCLDLWRQRDVGLECDRAPSQCLDIFR